MKSAIAICQALFTLKRIMLPKRVSWPLSRASVSGLLKLGKDDDVPGECLCVDAIDNKIVLWEEFIYLGGPLRTKYAAVGTGMAGKCAAGVRF